MTDPTSTPITDAQLREVALTRAEYRRIVQTLEHEPNPLELGIAGAMWSEHCGYKHSKLLLGRFPHDGEQVLIRAGEENAGAVAIGDGLAVVMKIESHNHPSAVEPFQGAATGVGGIVRDVFTMGARPIAALDSLRFGPPTTARNRHLFEGVVGGIGWYGNCLGLPTVGGEVVFGPSYSANPLVNAMCVGVAPVDDLVRARTGEAGNLVLMVGADTGRDGIHGATFASVEDPEASHRGVVQVGNPFLEKLLIEACLEAAQDPDVVGIQDLGAAGLTSSSVEAASRSNGGIELDIAQVPRRETGMTPYEVMLSESQERMVVIVRPGAEQRIQRLFDRWGLHSALIGRVTGDGHLVVRDGDAVVADLPTFFLTNPPLYRREGVPSPELARLQAFDVSTVPVPDDLNATLLTLLAAPNIASKQSVYRQYDHMVQAATVQAPGGDAAVLRLRDSQRGLAVCTDGNGRYCSLDPLMGGRAAVAEAARNVSCTGARPLAITNCLNFGNPEKAHIYYQLQQVIEGMAQACETLGTPVISGNVSLYNETDDEAVYPTPIVGMLGLLDDVSRHCPASFQGSGDRVALLGATRDELGASEYLATIHDTVAGRPPEVDLAREAAVQAVVRAAIARGLLHSAHDCSDGGLAVALAECCLSAAGPDIGLDATCPADGEELRADAVLFGESQARIVVSLPAEQWDELAALAAASDVPLSPLGTTGGRRFRLAPYLDVPLESVADAYRNGLERALTAADDTDSR